MNDARRIQAHFQCTMLIGAVLSMPGCVSSVFVSPAAIDRAVQRSEMALRGNGRTKNLTNLVAAYDERADDSYLNLAVFPDSEYLGTLGSSLVTLGYVGADVAQKNLDQQRPEWLMPAWSASNITISAERCAAAEQPATLTAASQHFAKALVGNPPEPLFAPVYIPVPLQPGNTQLRGDETCPSEQGASHLCIYGRLALQPGAAPLVIVVHGLFDSGDQHYIRDTGSVLFSTGNSVLLIDARDHGFTFRAQWWAPTTLGWYEGEDLLEAAQSLRRTPGCKERIAGIGLAGYSGGALFAIRAFIADRERPGDRILDRGVLAVSPVLDLKTTIEGMQVSGGSPRTCNALVILDGLPLPWIQASDCMNRGSIGSFFGNLLSARWTTLDTLGVSVPEDSWKIERYLERAETYGLTAAQIIQGVTPERIGEQLKLLPEYRDGEPFLAIVSSEDDPVVGGEPARVLDESLPNTPCRGGSRSGRVPACLFRPKVGGHIAYAVISQPLSRAFMREFFAEQAADGRRK